MYFRTPKTKQAKQQAYAYADVCPVRAKRRAHNIVSAWDDKNKATTRSWKAHRTTQYK